MRMPYPISAQWIALILRSYCGNQPSKGTGCRNDQPASGLIAERGDYVGCAWSNQEAFACI